MTIRPGWVILGLGLSAALAIGAEVLRHSLGPDASRLLEQAQANYRAGRLDRAEEALERLARLRAPTSMDHMARALVAEASGRFERALAELEAIGPEYPLAALAEQKAGQIELEHGSFRRAERHYLAALAKDPSLAPSRDRLAYLYNIQLRLREMDTQMEALSRLGALDFDALLHWSKARNVTWNPAADCEALARSIATDPEDRRSRLALAEGLRRMGRPDEAESVLRPLPDSDPEARAARSRLALDRGDEGRAESILSAGPPDDPALAGMRGQLALRRGGLRAAQANLRIALVADPDDRALLAAMGTALRIDGDERAAGPFLEKARRHDELTPVIAEAATPRGRSDPRLPARMGAACEAAGRDAEARAWYRLAIARDPLDTASQRALSRLERPVRTARFP